jgi:hypothetical protein
MYYGSTEGKFTYEGLWKDGVRHGLGIETEPNTDRSVNCEGTRYAGLWVNDKRHGPFKCENACGVFVANYNHGVLVTHDRFSLAGSGANIPTEG